ncbi:MAG: hypothetical protein IKY33_01145 [Clostridia bacterium]|nr:hypothetical protein [Clostridia bacterium]
MKPKYKDMYLKLMHATEDAINLLISAQQECEEIYLEDPSADIPKIIDANDFKK